MNTYATVLLLVNAVLLLLLPRRWTPLPLIVGACYMTLGQGVDIGPFTFTVIRLLVLVGFIRILIRGERLAGGINGLDRLMVLWAVLALMSSPFHQDIPAALVFRLGLVYNTCGIYFLIRTFCQSIEDLQILLHITAILLLPIAIEMIFERLGDYNLFHYLGGVPKFPDIREGKIRSQGPFRHAILAGTVGAVCLPLMVPLWNKHRKSAVAGIFSCIAIVYCSGSSGPLVSALTGIGGLFLWHYRHRIRLMRWIAVTGYIALDIVMKAPAYYMMARIPLVTGSSGWHRAKLIESAISNLSEWWLAGTDYTRHWMPTGVSWSPDHADITNHYIMLGVMGGLPLMLIFIVILYKGFSYVGQAFQIVSDQEMKKKFLIWALGSSIFANAATMISVSYFDQSFIFLYLVLAAIGSAWSVTSLARAKDKQPDLVQ